MDVQVDLEEDRFDVTHDAGRVATDALLDAIRKLEYEPVVVERAPGASKSGTTQVDLAALPEELAKLFGEARDASKPVLLQFSGPG